MHHCIFYILLLLLLCFFLVFESRKTGEMRKKQAFGLVLVKGDSSSAASLLQTVER